MYFNFTQWQYSILHNNRLLTKGLRQNKNYKQMVFQLIIKYLHKHSLNACRFSKSPLGGATNPFQPSFSKPLRVLPFLSLYFLFLSQPAHRI